MTLYKSFRNSRQTTFLESAVETQQINARISAWKRVVFIVIGGLSMTSAAQTTEEWAKIKAEAEAKAAALAAQQKAIEAERSLEAVKKETDAGKKELADQVETAKGLKEIADYRKAQADAQLATFKAKMGDVTASGYTGAVELKTDAGKIEAHLLAAKAIASAADKLSGQLKDRIPVGSALVVTTSSSVPTFNNIQIFRLQKSMFDVAKNDTEKFALSAKPPPTPAIALAVPPIAAVGLALDSFNKILSYFKTDYSIGGADVSYEDSPLISATAGALTKNGFSVRLPGIYDRAAQNKAATDLQKDVLELVTARAKAQFEQDRWDAHTTTYNALAEKEADPKKKQPLVDEAKKCKEVADKWKALAAIYDTLFAKIMTNDEKGVSPLVNLVKESAISSQLDSPNTYLVVVTLAKTGGTYFTKKNLLTSIGAIPFFVAGGAVVNYSVIKGIDGMVAAAGTVPLHGGYKSVDRVADELQ